MNIKNIISKITKIMKIKLLKKKYEHTFESERCKLKYLFFPNKNSNKLLVVFSAFPGKDRPAVYNYIEKFKNLECNKLYILDNFGPDIRGGSYYLGKNKDFFVEEAVNLLIKDTADYLGIENKNIITTGTSKGGFASLYFAFKYNYGAAISGAPQTILGKYLSDHRSYFEYIAGEYNECNVKYLDDLLFDVVKIKKGKPEIYLHVGRNEHHYSEHVIPFCEYLESNNIAFKLDVQDYDSHNQVGRFYPEFALKYLNGLIETK